MNIANFYVNFASTAYLDFIYFQALWRSHGHVYYWFHFTKRWQQIFLAKQNRCSIRIVYKSLLASKVVSDEASCSYLYKKKNKKLKRCRAHTTFIFTNKTFHPKCFIFHFNHIEKQVMQASFLLKSTRTPTSSCYRRC